MAAKRKTRASERAARIRAAAEHGAVAAHVGALFQREILLHRVALGITNAAQTAFATQVQAPIMLAVGAALSSTRRPTAPFDPATAGRLPPPLPDIVPPALTAALELIAETGGRRVFSGIADGTRAIATSESRAAINTTVEAYGFNMAPRGSPLANVRVIPVEGAGLVSIAPQQDAVAELAREAAARAQTTPMLGQLVSTTWDNALGGLVDKVKAEVAQGLARGTSTDQIVRGLRGTRTNAFRDGVLGKWREHQVRAFVRTAVTHGVTVARETSFAALGAPLVQLIATLDLRTTPICISLDHEVYPIGSGPRPPLHPNCRTTIVCLFDAADAKREGTRASFRGQVDARFDARGFFLTLTDAQQAQLVGPTRAAMLRSGEIDWKDLFGPGLEPLTLAEIENNR